MKTSILEMLSGAAIPVNTSTFRNDAVNFQNRNDVLTYLMHLRYLGYDPNRQTAFVPNEEIRQELVFSGREHPLELKWNHNARTALPLRYNYDKPEKPRISRVFGYLARFFILFQTEKSSREVITL